MAVEIAFGYGSRLLSNLIMTRLLLPEAFGLMAIVSLIITAVVLFSDIGIKQSIVRFSEGKDEEFLKTAWTVQVMRGFVIAGVIALVGVCLYFTADYWAKPETVYADPRLPFLIIVSSFSVVFEGFVSTNKWVAFRDFDFRRLTLVGITTQVGTIGSLLVVGILYPTVWALLVGMLFGGLFGCLLSHLMFSGPRMSFLWREDYVDRLWSFGKWLIISSAFSFLRNNADRLFLGYYMTKAIFGFYVIAFMWVSLAVRLIQRITDSVAYPMLSAEMRENPGNLYNRFRKLQLFVDVLTVLFFLICLFMGPPLVGLIYPASYIQSAIFVPFLALMVLHVRFVLLASMMLVREDSKSVAELSSIQAISLCVSLFVLHSIFGLLGALYATAMSPVLGSAYVTFKNREFLGKSIWIPIAWMLATIMISLLIFQGFAFETIAEAQ